MATSKAVANNTPNMNMATGHHGIDENEMGKTGGQGGIRPGLTNKHEQKTTKGGGEKRCRVELKSLCRNESRGRGR